jgi:hypothetical protein
MVHSDQAVGRPAISCADVGCEVFILPVDVRSAQEQPTWCWAACAQAVLAYRGSAPTTQRALVESVPRLRRAHADGRGAEDEGLAIDELGEFFIRHVPETIVIPHALEEGTLRAFLAQRRPVIVWFDWGLAHVCLVYGMVGDRFLLYDPKGPATGDLSYDELLYRGRGPTPITWKYSWVF